MKILMLTRSERNKLPTQNNLAFTVVELVIVVAVLAILSAVTIVGYGTWQDSIARSQLKSDLSNVAAAMEDERNFGSGYPSSLPSTIVAGEGITFTIISSSAEEFCINGTTARSASAIYHIDETYGSTGVQEGACAINIPSEQMAKLISGDAAADEFFGYSVSISGDTAVVGVFGDDQAGVDSGAAYVFTRTGSAWTQRVKLTAADAEASDQFGRAVAISGDTIVVGAYADDDVGAQAGSAYVFTRFGSTWSQQAKFTASDGGVGDYFGWAVSIYGNTAVVGAYLDDDGASNAGSAYVFTRSGSSWSQQAKLTASDPAASRNFGYSVSISGDTAAVGGGFGDTADTGSAYVFTRSGSSWSQQAKLTASDAMGKDYGYTVSISGDTAVVAGGYVNPVGSAYVFTRSGSTWSQQAKLTASDGVFDDGYGLIVSVSGDIAVVGAYADGEMYNGSGSGSAYVFTRSGSSWSQQAKLTASDAAAGDRFSGSISISGDTAAIGAFYDDDSGSDSGSVYIFN